MISSFPLSKIVISTILNLMQRNLGMVITIIWWLVKNCGMSIKITYLKIHQNILEF